MIAWSSSFCFPPGIKVVKGIKALNANGWGGKTAITSILKQEWCGSVACDLLSRIKILYIIK
jgi:hypothetical protein